MPYFIITTLIYSAVVWVNNHHYAHFNVSRVNSFSCMSNLMPSRPLFGCSYSHALLLFLTQVIIGGRYTRTVYHCSPSTMARSSILYLGIGDITLGLGMMRGTLDPIMPTSVQISLLILDHQMWLCIRCGVAAHWATPQGDSSCATPHRARPQWADSITDCPHFVAANSRLRPRVRSSVLLV